MKKRLALLSVAGWLVLEMALACRPRVQELETDPRAALPLPPQAAMAVRAEMRTMLGSLHSILAALPVGDTAAILQAARASGLAAAADPALEGILPEAFLVLGMATHRQFDSLAAEVAAGVSPDAVVRRLGLVTANCVSCHESYQLTTGKAP